MKQLIIGMVFLVGFLVAQGASADERYVVTGRIEAETLYCLTLNPPCEAAPSGPIAVSGTPVEIRKLNGALVTSTRTRLTGRFKVLLRKGAYRLTLPEFGKMKRFQVGTRSKDLGTISIIPVAPAAQ